MDVTHRAATSCAACWAQVLLRYSLQHGVACIPKSSKPERVVESAKVFEVTLTDGQMAQLDALKDARRGAAASIQSHLKIIAAPNYHWDAETSSVAIQ